MQAIVRTQGNRTFFPGCCKETFSGKTCLGKSQSFSHGFSPGVNLAVADIVVVKKMFNTFFL